jgi:hypothetical protein
VIEQRRGVTRDEQRRDVVFALMVALAGIERGRVLCVADVLHVLRVTSCVEENSEAP